MSRESTIYLPNISSWANSCSFQSRVIFNRSITQHRDGQQAATPSQTEGPRFGCRLSPLWHVNREASPFTSSLSASWQAPSQPIYPGQKSGLRVIGHSALPEMQRLGCLAASRFHPGLALDTDLGELPIIENLVHTSEDDCSSI
jgi:hypothetical protein